MPDNIMTDTNTQQANHISCDDCGLFPLCEPIAIDGQELNIADEFVERHQPIKAGTYLFKEGQPFEAIYAVTSGAFKLVNMDPHTKELVVGFVLAGETVGQTAIFPNAYPCSAIALEDSHVCKLPMEAITDIAHQSLALQKNLQHMLNKENFELHRQFAMLMARKNAEQRLAAFLINQSMRLEERGFSSEQFQLPMSRDDISNFLGLRKETLSRLFTKLHQSGSIAVRGKHIRILDMPLLRQSSGLPSSL